MRLLVGTNLFYPLYGGGEKALIDWLMDFHERGIEICVMTTVPEVEGFDMEFPFEIIRLTPKKPYSEKNRRRRDESLFGGRTPSTLSSCS